MEALQNVSTHQDIIIDEKIQLGLKSRTLFRVVFLLYEFSLEMIIEKNSSVGLGTTVVVCIVIA